MIHELLIRQAGGLFDISPWLSGAGPWLLVIVAAIVFIETGLLFPFLPGDTLLFTAALVAPAAGVPVWLRVEHSPHQMPEREPIPAHTRRSSTIEQASFSRRFL